MIIKSHLQNDENNRVDVTARCREFLPHLSLCCDITVTGTSAAVIDRVAELARAAAMTVGHREARVMFNALVGDGRR